MSRIILVEDHERLAELIVSKLHAAGVAVDVFDTCGSAWSAMKMVPYEAMILDRSLPDGDGLSLLARLRGDGIGLPCMVLTARDALHDRIEGLDIGADDYLTKPFAMDEMVARVRALLRRPVTNVALDPSYGDLQVKPELSVLSCGDNTVSLSPAELQIMLTLILKSGEVVRHSTLESAAWGLGEAVTPNALDVAIHRLRKKLLAIRSTMKIVNLRNLGYVLREDKL